MVILKRSDLSFPPVTKANRDGLLALGGDLSVQRLLLAYRSGIFPWTEEPITWWAPDPRAIFDIDHFKPPNRLQQKIRNVPFNVTFNKCFRDVISNCARSAPGRETTWIGPAFINAYEIMHHQGYAHSVEIWLDSKLVGGIYGVALGGFFAGESMFHHVSDASKVALTALMNHLKAKGFQLFDTQVLSPTTARLGAFTISRAEYLRRLQIALRLDVSFQ